MSHRSRILRATALVAAFGVVAACGDDDGGTDTAATTEAPSSDGSTTTAAGGQGSSGGTACADGDLPEEISVGVSMPQTGNVATTGNDAIAGIRIAADYVEQEVLPGHTLDLDIRDDAFDRQRMLTNVQHFVEEHVVAQVGPLGTNAAAVLPLAQDANLPSLIVATPSPEGLGVGDMINFTTGSVVTDGPPVLLDTLKDAGLTYDHPVIAIDDTNPAAVTFLDNLKSELSDQGVDVAKTVSFAVGATDYSAEVTAITSEHPDTVFVDGNHPSIGIFLKQLKESGYDGVIAGSLQTAVPTFKEIVGDSVDGMIGLGYWVPNVDSETELSRQFVETYKGDHGGSDPTSYFGIAADSMLSLGHALAAGCSTEPDDIVAALAGMPPFDGVQADGITWGDDHVVDIQPTTYVWVDGALQALSADNAPPQGQ